MHRRVAFVQNQLAFRGTQGTLWKLADMNETVLGNKSIIISLLPPNFRDEDTTAESIKYFTDRFETHFITSMDALEVFLKDNCIHCVYTPIAGDHGSFRTVPKSVATIVHCVFQAYHPIGTVQVAISPYVARGRCRVLQNIIDVDWTVNDDLRESLDIPKDAKVFGRYGGLGTFNIPFVQEAVIEFAKDNPRTYFLFMNTQKFGPNLPNVIFVPPTRDVREKTRFIRTCDAMLHARKDGETQGMSVGEFAILGKPIITCLSGDYAHLEYLGDQAFVYNSKEGLRQILYAIPRGLTITKTKYDECAPELVIAEFEKLLEEAIDTFNKTNATQTQHKRNTNAK